VIARALSVGARALLSAGVAIDLGDVDQTVRRVLAEVTTEAEARVGELLEAGRAALAADLDPRHRDSIVGKALEDFHRWRDTTLTALDPQVGGSSAAKLVGGLTEHLDAFEERLGATLDPTADGSGFATLSTQMDEMFRELLTQLGREQGKHEEALVGTAKGVDFEDVIEVRLREVGRAIGGCIIERTSRLGGTLGSEVLVGDFVLTLPSGRRVVVEAKNQSRLSLHGSKGILAELDRAMANRGADLAVCVSATTAFPAEVGSLGHFGKALLVVDDGRGDLLEPAIRWAAALAEQARAADDVDAAVVIEAMERIRSKARQLSEAKRALTEIGKSVTQVQGTLDGLRRELIDTVDEVCSGLRVDRAA
jgi:hypothetical protein